MLLTHFEDYREVLRHKLEERCRRNLRYSLRAFARDLGLSPARLSQVLKAKQGLSLKWAQHLADRMGLSEQEKSRFCDLVESKHARNPTRREMARKRLAQSPSLAQNQLDLDSFKAISDWYHFAILSLAELPEFNSDPAWIAKRLGIQVVLVDAAVERLIRLGQLRHDPDGRLKVVTDATYVGTGVPSSALKDYHRQILEKASQAIFDQPVTSREFNSGFISIRKNRVAEAQKRLEELRQRFWQWAGDTCDGDSVYCLSTAFFRIDQEPKGEST